MFRDSPPWEIREALSLFLVGIGIGQKVYLGWCEELLQEDVHGFHQFQLKKGIQVFQESHFRRYVLWLLYLLLPFWELFELNRLSTCFTFGTQMTLITSGLADESAISKVANERTSSQPLLMGGFGHRPTWEFPTREDADIATGHVQEGKTHNCWYYVSN